MLAIEAQRSVPSSKVEKHFVNFQAMIALLEYLNLPTEIFNEKASSYKGISEQATAILDSLVAKLLSTAERLPNDLLDNLYDYLSEADPLIAADLIFVPGAKTQFRINKAIELYKKGLAPMILVSGKVPFYKQISLSEAEWYKNIAVAADVSEANILIDDRSITLPDNVRTSLNLLDEQAVKYQRIILVNSPYTQRRTWAHFKKYTNDDTYLCRVNSETKSALIKEHWFKSEDGIRIIANEYVKMKIAQTINSI